MKAIIRQATTKALLFKRAPCYSPSQFLYQYNIQTFSNKVHQIMPKRAEKVKHDEADG